MTFFNALVIQLSPWINTSIVINFFLLWAYRQRKTWAVSDPIQILFLYKTTLFFYHLMKFSLS